MDNIEYSLIIPSYKEAENLKLLLPKAVSVFNKMAEPYEIMVVDTLEPLDDTRAVCQANGVSYVNRTGGNTYGDAVRTGVTSSKGKYVIFMDADGSHAPTFIPQLAVHKETHDVVIASRYVDGGGSDNSLALILMSRVVNIAYSVVLGIKCKDVSNSFRLYRGELLRKTEVQCQNFDVVEELLVKMASRNPGLRLHEVPFVFEKRIHGESKRDLLRFAMTYLVSLARLRRLK